MCKHRWLCVHPVQHWKVDLLRLYHLFIFVGAVVLLGMIVICSPNWTSPQLAYESRKAKKIIASRDISFAFTNMLANNYYSLRSLSFTICF